MPFLIIVWKSYLLSYVKYFYNEKKKITLFYSLIFRLLCTKLSKVLLLLTLCFVLRREMSIFWFYSVFQTFSSRTERGFQLVYDFISLFNKESPGLGHCVNYILSRITIIVKDFFFNWSFSIKTSANPQGYKDASYCCLYFLASEQLYSRCITFLWATF